MSDDPVPAQLIETICMQQRTQWLSGQRLPVEAYIEQNPLLQNRADDVLELVYNEVLLREELGDTPHLDEYLSRFPACAPALRSLFEVHRALERSSLRGSSRTEPPLGRTMADANAERPAHQRFTAHEIVREPGRSVMGLRIIRWCRQAPIAAALFAATLGLLIVISVAGVVRHRNTSNTLRESLRREALINLQSNEPDPWAARQALREAAAIRPGVDLRNAFVRCLDLAGVRPLAFPRSADPLWSIGRAALASNRSAIHTVMDGEAIEINSVTGDIIQRQTVVGTFKPVTEQSPDGRYVVFWKRTAKGARLWDRQNPSQPRDLNDVNGMSYAPRCVAFCDQSHLLATAHLNGNDKVAVILYDLRAHELAPSAQFRLDAIDIDCMRFDPSRMTLAASVLRTAQGPPARRQHALLLIDVPSRQLQTMLELDHDGPWRLCERPRRIAFGGGGRVLIAAGINSAIRRWDVNALTDGKEGTLIGAMHPHPAQHLYIAPDDRWLATVDLEGNLKIWDLHARRNLRPVRSESAPATRSNSRWTLLADRDIHADQGVRLWEFTRPLSRTVDFDRSHDDKDRSRQTIDALVFSPGERWLVCGRSMAAPPGLIDLSNLDTAPLALEDPPTAATPVGGEDLSARGVPVRMPAAMAVMAFDPVADRLWYLGNDGSRRVWRLPGPHAEVAPANVLQRQWMDLRVTKNGTTVALGRDGRGLQVVRIDAAESDIVQLAHVIGHDPTAKQRTLFNTSRTCRLSGDAGFVAVCEPRGANSRLSVVDLSTRHCVIEETLPPGVSCVAINNDGGLVTAGHGRQLSVFDVKARRKTHVLEDPGHGHAADVVDVACSAGLVISAARDGSVCLWSAKTGELLVNLPSQQQTVRHIALSPSARWVAAGDELGDVRIWDLAEIRTRLAEVDLDWDAPPIIPAS